MRINVRRHRRIIYLDVASAITCLVLTIFHGNLVCAEIWPMERPNAMPAIQALEVMCGKDHMDVHLSFSQPFEGIVSSKGQHGDPRCVYVPPATGQTYFSFRIAYARCGTKPDLNGQFYENTVVVQYDKDLLEVWDEAKRLRCEWFNDYEKTATKPPMVIADLDVIQLDFRGDNVDCWMEIQHGKGPWAPPVSGIVPLGSTLTLVVAINDFRGEFDMRVKSCVASDGGGHVIQLSDDSGCVLRPKMISRFLKAKGADDRASVITYAFFHAFKFPDALSVHIKCKVEICRHGCLDHCQHQHATLPSTEEQHLYGGVPLERKDDVSAAGKHSNVQTDSQRDDIIYDDHSQDPPSSSPNSNPLKLPLKKKDVLSTNSKPGADSDALLDGDLETLATNLGEVVQSNTANQIDEIGAVLPDKDSFTMEHEKFPHGPRAFNNNQDEIVPLGAPRSIMDGEGEANYQKRHNNASTFLRRPGVNRKRRSMVVSDRKVRSADVGVSGLYEVISEADLAFSPDNKAEAVTVFQGKIREEVVYGICMPVPGFSILFVFVAVSAVVSALVAGSLLYKYQLQREHKVVEARGALAMSTLSYWAGLGFLGRCPPSACSPTLNRDLMVTPEASDPPSISSVNHHHHHHHHHHLNGKTDSLRSCN